MNIMKTSMALAAVVSIAFSMDAEAKCAWGGNFQGSCTPADFLFLPATLDAEMTGYFWARCSGNRATGADSKYDARTGFGADNGAVVAPGLVYSYSNAGPNTGSYRISAGGWNVNPGFDGCPIATDASCVAGQAANSETVFVMTNGNSPVSRPATFAVAVVRYIGGNGYYDIDSIAGGAGNIACFQTCRVTMDGGANWLSCGSGQSNVGFSVQPVLAWDPSLNVATLAWSLPAIRSNVAGSAFPISSWGIYRIDSPTSPASFKESDWTEVRRVPGSATMASFDPGPEPSDAYWFALKPRFDGNGGLAADGGACSPGIDCEAISANTFDSTTAQRAGTPKVGPATNESIQSFATAALIIEEIDSPELEILGKDIR